MNEVIFIGERDTVMKCGVTYLSADFMIEIGRNILLIVINGKSNESYHCESKVA